MLGAVFQYELLLAGRRRRTHFLRWLYAALVLTQHVTVLAFLTFFDAQDAVAYRGFFASFLGQHFVILLALTPALTAGALADEKTHGNLDFLLTANLRPLDIVLGKLLGRAYGLVVLALVGLPVVCFFGAIADLSVSFPLAFLVVSLLLIFGVAAIGTLASVWCRHARDAILATYLLGLAVLFVGARWAGTWEAFDPWHAMALDDPEQRWPRLGAFALAWLTLGGTCVLIAAWRLRPAYLKQYRPTRRKLSWRHGRRPRCRGNPVLWRERWVQGFAPLAPLRAFPVWLGVAAVLLATAVSLGYSLLRPLPNGVNPWTLLQAGEFAELRAALERVPGRAETVRAHGLAVLQLFALMTAVRAAGSITGEREQGTWMTLLMTPLTTRAIVRGKLWGIFRACLPYLLAYAAAALPIAWFVGTNALFGQAALLLVLGLTLIYVITVGLWCSVRARSTWRSLLLTWVHCYLTWLGLLAVLGCFGSMLVGFVEALVRLTRPFADLVSPFEDVPLGYVLILLALVLTFGAFTLRLLNSVEAYIDGEERTRIHDSSPYFIRRELERKLEEQAVEDYRRKIAADEKTIPLADD